MNVSVKDINFNVSMGLDAYSPMIPEFSQEFRSLGAPIEIT